MADTAPEFQPDILAALRLALVGLGTLTQAVEGIAANVPTAALLGWNVRRAQKTFETAAMLLTAPAADPLPVLPGAEAALSEGDAALSEGDARQGDAAPSPDPQPGDKDG